MHAVISGNIVHDITDHIPNFLILNKLSFSFSKQEMHKRDYSRLDEADLLRDVQSVNWHHIFQPEDNVNNVFSSFRSHISSIIDKHAPVRKLSKTEIKTRRKPWITPGLKKSITTKNKSFHKYINNKSDFNHRQLKLYRNKLKHLIDISKKQHYCKYFAENMNNMKNTWRGIKQLITTKSKIENSLSQLV